MRKNQKSVDLFSDEFIAELDAVKLPITKFNALLKLLRKAINSYGRTNKVKAQEFDERLRNVVDAYNSRDKLVFTSEVVADFVNDLSDQLLQILKDLQDDKASFEKMGITFEEKAFYDILVRVRDTHGFPYADEKCIVLAKKIRPCLKIVNTPKRRICFSPYGVDFPCNTQSIAAKKSPCRALPPYPYGCWCWF